jgi:hypothetical protein
MNQLPLPGEPSRDKGAALLSRLVAMRRELIEGMARDRIDGGSLALLAGIAAAIETIKGDRRGDSDNRNPHRRAAAHIIYRCNPNEPDRASAWELGQ